MALTDVLAEEVKAKLKRLEQIEGFFAAFASGEMQRKWGHIRREHCEGLRRPILVVDNRPGL